MKKLTEFNLFAVSGRKQLQQKIIDKVNTSLHDLSKQLDETNSRVNFLEKNIDEFQEEKKLNEIKHLTEANKSLIEFVESSSKAFDISLRKLQIEKNKFIEYSKKATVQNVYDVCVFDRFEKKSSF